MPKLALNERYFPPSKRDWFWSRVNKYAGMPDFTDPLVTAPRTSCWAWLGAKSRAGYGRVAWADGERDRTAAAHRISYTDLVGPIPDGRLLDHLCRRRDCVNPAHLEPVTNRDNLVRGATVVRERALRTHCPSGHEYTAENTRYKRGTERYCRECHLAYNREYGRRKRAEARLKAG